MKQDARDAVDNIQADVRQSAESIKEDVQWARTRSESDPR